MASKGGLGTGLSALFEDNKTNTDSGQTLRITEIEPNREQPRKNFDDESISALAESIKQHGILQPLLVRPYGSGYQIVAGERRWRAARMLGLSEVPVQIKDFVKDNPETDLSAYFKESISRPFYVKKS